MTGLLLTVQIGRARRQPAAWRGLASTHGREGIPLPTALPASAAAGAWSPCAHFQGLWSSVGQVLCTEDRVSSVDVDRWWSL